MGNMSMMVAQHPRSSLLQTALSALILSLSVLPSAQAETDKLVITGSSTMAPLVLEIGKRFETLHSQIRVDVQTGGSSRGIADTLNGLADIGMVSRSLHEQENHLHGVVVAHDGIALIVHASNPLTQLSIDQIRKIFRGDILRWVEVGGHDAPITVVNKAQGRSTLKLFLEYFHLSPRQVRAHVVIGDNEQGIKTVAGNPNAIGYVSVGTAQYDASHGVPIRLLPLNSIPANRDTIQSGTFPLTRPLTLVTKSHPVGLIKTFIDFARSPQVHDLITQQYFVPTDG